MNEREVRPAALDAAIAASGKTDIESILQRAGKFYDWLVKPAPLPPPAFGFVSSVAGKQIESTPVAEYRSDLLSIDEACNLMGLSEPTMRRNAASDPNFPQKIKISKRRVAYRREDIERYLTEQTQ